MSCQTRDGKEGCNRQLEQAELQCFHFSPATSLTTHQTQPDLVIIVSETEEAVRSLVYWEARTVNCELRRSVGGGEWPLS